MKNLLHKAADRLHDSLYATSTREPIRRTKTQNRNEPCKCGSHKKFKNCCIKKFN